MRRTTHRIRTALRKEVERWRLVSAWTRKAGLADDLPQDTWLTESERPITINRTTSPKHSRHWATTKNKQTKQNTPRNPREAGFRTFLRDSRSSTLSLRSADDRGRTPLADRRRLGGTTMSDSSSTGWEFYKLQRPLPLLAATLARERPPLVGGWSSSPWRISPRRMRAAIRSDRPAGLEQRRRGLPVRRRHAQTVDLPLPGERPELRLGELSDEQLSRCWTCCSWSRACAAGPTRSW